MMKKLHVIILMMMGAMCWHSLALANQGKYWIFFTDKGPAASTTSLSFVRISDRAMLRRAKIAPAAGVDSYDLPLYQPYLRELRSRQIMPIVQSRWLNAVSAYLDADQLADLTALWFIKKIQPVRQFFIPPVRVSTIPPSKAYGNADDEAAYGPSLAQNALMKVPEVHRLGLTGWGVIVGMLDTGFNYKEHIALAHLDVLNEYDFIFDDEVTRNEVEDVSSQHNHGTETLSVLAGYDYGNLIGPAYDASFLLAKTENVASETSVEEDYWVAGIEWMEAQGVDVVSSSVGYNDWYEYSDMDGDTPVTTRAADIAARKGVVVVNSMGNEGARSWRYMIAPADGDSVISAGAVTPDGTLASFSSVGPTY
ncbi:MAG: hypothetical protein D6820_09290, partial [Lentisphaerae bacterium]